jgi:4-hydroxy-tetrahydrodipicolinate synthase
MQAAAAALPCDRLMVGTGAAALGDAIELTAAAADLGFSGALLLPPFYYKSVADDGLAAFVTAVADATVSPEIPLYLYNFPQMTGIVWSETLVRRLKDKLGPRLAGLKDSSGDLAYARTMAKIEGLAVFPSSEAVLLDARAGTFAGCISATANVNASLCNRVFHQGDEDALAMAVAIRDLLGTAPLIPGIKSVLAHNYSDRAWTRVLPPLLDLEKSSQDSIVRRVNEIRSSTSSMLRNC